MMLAELTAQERGELAERLLSACRKLEQEAIELRKCPAVTRNYLYGEGCMESAAAAMCEVRDFIITELVPIPRAES